MTSLKIRTCHKCGELWELNWNGHANTCIWCGTVLARICDTCDGEGDTEVDQDYVVDCPDCSGIGFLYTEDESE